jgi:D-alanyl-D-alanine carboxypeptidase (penicillin-binding protein 5/6)
MTRFARVGQAIASAMIVGLLAASPAAAFGVAQPGQPIPCPKADSPPVQAPRLSPPPQSPGARIVGGDQLLSSGLVVAPGASPPPAVTATSWVVADLGTGKVIGACGAHEYGAPASVQKLLLAATLLARLDPHQIVTVTADDLQYEPGSSAAGLVEGGQYTVETLWLGLLLVSGNDAANVLARLGGGAAGLVGGVAEMNAQAQRLGAFKTHAATPSGLDGPGQVTTAYDLALIARACFADESFVRYALTKQAQIPAQPLKQREGFQIQNQNHLIDRYPGALGGKTGFTDLARHTYVGAAERDGRRLVVTLLGAEHAPAQGWEQGAALLDWGFAQPSSTSVGTLVDPSELVSPSPAASVPPGAVSALPHPARRAPGIVALGAAAACVALAVAVTRSRSRRGR